MKQRKKTYSLTAKERKQKRIAAQNGGNKRVADVRENRDAAEATMIAEQKKSKRSAAFIGAVVCVAVVLVLVALLVPVISYLVNPYRGYKDVIARFNLSNGMVLEYVVEEEEYDTAATNFIFLAKNGYFDNTVFFDAQSGWLRFGGYEDQPSASATSSSDYSRTKHHSQNESYCSKFGALKNSLFENVRDKFTYYLRADSNGTKTALLEQKGVLAFLYDKTHTEFQLSYDDQPTELVKVVSSNGTESTETLRATRVGHALNDETIRNIEIIASTKEVNDRISSGYRWEPPSPTIYIESVKVYNLDSKKWRNFDFIEYMKGNDSSGVRRLSGWTSIL